MELGRLHIQLKKRGISLTYQRSRIFEEMAILGSFTVQALLFKLTDKLGRVTIYRTIQLFLKNDIIHEIEPGTYELTDRFIQHHHYLKCRACGKRFAFNSETLEKQLMRLAAKRHFILEDHHLSLTGLCPRCSQTEPARKAIGLSLRRHPD